MLPSKTNPKKTRDRPSVLAADNAGDSTRTLGRGAQGRANALAYTRAIRGRPAKGATAVGTSTKTLRLGSDIWQLLEAEAERRGIPLHTLLRVIVADFLFARPVVARAPRRSKSA